MTSPALGPVLLLLTGAVCTGEADVGDSGGPSPSQEALLHRTLFPSVVPSIRPPANNSADSLPVEFGLSIIQLDELDESKQKIHIFGWYKMSWRDSQLTWNPDEYEGLTSTRTSVKKIWTPDITLLNNAGSSSQGDTLATVTSSGEVTWVPYLHISASCPTNMADYPYDSHTCTLRFGSRTYSSQNGINLKMKGTVETTTAYYTEHNAWNVKVDDASVTPKDCCPNQGSEVKYEVTLTRKTVFYKYLVIAPAVVFALLMPFVFLLPYSFVDRILFASIILLSTVMISGHFLGGAPEAYNSAPVLGRYLLFNVVVAAISTLFSVYFTDLYEKSERRGPLPAAIKKLVGAVGCLMCTSVDDYRPISTGDTEYKKGDSDRATVTAQWRHLCVVLDRLFFLIFMTITIVRLVPYV